MPDTTKEDCEVFRITVPKEHSTGFVQYLRKLPVLIGNLESEFFATVEAGGKVHATVETDSKGLHHVQLHSGEVTVNSLTSNNITTDSFNDRIIKIHVDGTLPLIITCRVGSLGSKLLKRPDHLVETVPEATEAKGPMEDLKMVQADRAANMSIEEICKKYQRTSAWYYLLIHLERLDPELQKEMLMTVPRRERLCGDVGEIISRVPDHAKQREIWKVVREEASGTQRKNKARQLVDVYLRDNPKTPRPKDEKTLPAKQEAKSTETGPSTEVSVVVETALNQISSGLAGISNVEISKLSTLPDIDDPNGLVKKLVDLERWLFDVRQKATRARTFARNPQKQQPAKGH